MLLIQVIRWSFTFCGHNRKSQKHPRGDEFCVGDFTNRWTDVLVWRFSFVRLRFRVEFTTVRDMFRPKSARHTIRLLFQLWAGCAWPAAPRCAPLFQQVGNLLVMSNGNVRLEQEPYCVSGRFRSNMSRTVVNSTLKRSLTKENRQTSTSVQRFVKSPTQNSSPRRVLLDLRLCPQNVKLQRITWINNIGGHI